MKVHEKIRFMRKSKGWTQEDMADSFNCKILQSTDLSDDKKELEHELEKARMLLQQQEKENAYLNVNTSKLFDSYQKSDETTCY